MIVEKDLFNAACRTVVSEMAAAKYHGQLDVVHSELKLLKDTIESLKDSQSELQNSVQVMDMTAIYGLLGEMSKRMDEFDAEIKKEQEADIMYAESLDSLDIPEVREAEAAEVAAVIENSKKHCVGDSLMVLCSIIGFTTLVVGGWFTLISITNAYVASGALDAYL